MSLSRPRQNYHTDSESAVNKQINLELYSSYVYQSLAWYFDRDDVALRGFHKYFKHASEEKREQAEKFMKFQNQRGGRIMLSDIKRPDRDEWGTGLQAMELSLELEKNKNQARLDLFKVAERHGDSQMCDWIQDNFLTEQVETIKQVCDHITNLKRVGPGLGEYMFDKKTLEGGDD